MEMPMIVEQVSASVCDVSRSQVAEPGRACAPPVVFHRFAPGTYNPMRADRSAAGSLPVRAYRYCEAVTTASSFGWYLFPPIDFALQFDGAEVICHFPDLGNEWYPILNGVQLPGLEEYFASAAPKDCRDFVPKFLVSLPVPGLVQVWTGYFARTAPDWSLVVRGPVNTPRGLNHMNYEGVVEYDKWPGSVFANIKLLKTDYPIEFQKSMPLLQVQPVHRSTYNDDFLNRFEVAGPDWDSFRQVVVAPNSNPDRLRGEYAVGVRKRPDPSALVCAAANLQR
jgi:hypothetical protein